MNNISTSMEPVYRTCYCYDSAAGKMTHRTYNYTEMLEKMASAPARDGITYWEPDEYGRVYIDPKHPSTATLETEPSSGFQLPRSSGLPSVNTRTEEKQKAKKAEERKDQEEQTRLLREDRMRMSQHEQLLHRLSMALLNMERY